MIKVHELSKTFRISKRAPGFMSAVKALVRREYTEVEALKSISFDIERGEIVGYIGPNGAGKSTTIKIMSGILVPDSGICEISGRTPWRDRIKHVKGIGVVFGQRSQLLWDIPVMDSFELIKDIYKVPVKEFKQNLDRLVETLNLKQVLVTPVRQLSLGQRMRCEITASLLHSPELLFLDEPTIGLDAVSKVAVREFIKDINREKGVTVILTTHDMGDIDALTDRVMLIGKGQLLYNGSFNSLKSKYNTYNVLNVEYNGEHFTPEEGDGFELVANFKGKFSVKLDTGRRTVAGTIKEFSEILDIRDISIEPRPVEEIIVDLYEEYEI